MIKVNITVPEEFLRAADSTAKEQRLSRSEFFRRAVEAFWEKQENERRERERTLRIEGAIEAQDRLGQLSGDWDGVAEIRKWREARR